MQEQAEQVMLPNGNDTVQSRLPPPEEEVPVFKVHLYLLILV